MMTYYKVFISSDDCRSFCQEIQTKTKQNLNRSSTVCFIEAVIDDQQLYIKNYKDKQFWTDTLDTGESANDCERRTVSEVLHELADSLPFAGSVVDVYLDIPEEFNSNCEGFLPLYGAIRRLKDWNNAAVFWLDKESEQTCTEHDLIELIPGIHVYSRSNSLDNVMWRGKISVVDKTVNRGFILPGVELQIKDNDNESLIRHPNPTENEEDVVLGRMLEVLDEIDVTTIPGYMLTSNRFYLSQQYHHQHTTVFIDHIKSTQNGLLIRLSCYHGNILETLCSDKYLNTTSWKESIIADITYIQEPEEELLPGYEFLHFVAYYNKEKQDIIMHQLTSPYQLDGQLFQLIYHNSLLPVAENEADDTLNFLSELPVFSTDSWKEMMTCLKDIQIQCLKEWIDEKTQSNCSTVIELSELHAFLHNVQRTFLQHLKDCLPECDVSNQQLPDLQSLSELEESPSSWSERCLLIYQESQRKSLSRLQSTDSMALSSPVQSEDMATTIDLAQFLKLFQEDGNPSALKLSPVRKRHPSRSFRLQNSLDMQKAAWPDCHYMPHFDIYYNIGKKIERQENQNHKFREKHIKAETFTSGPTTLFKLPKKKCSDSLSGKDQHPAKSALLCPRRSPRKSAGSKLTPPKKLMKGSLFSPRKSAGRGLMSPRKPLKKSVLWSPRKGIAKTTHLLSPTRKSPRKKLKVDLNTSLPGKRKPSTAVDKIRISETKRRHSVGDVHLKKSEEIHGRRSLSSANDSLNMSAGSGLDDSMNTQNRKESRSERHKRKLEEIVDNALKQHGVDKSSSIYQSCSLKLFKVTKLFVMDLPTSQNLKEEMKNIAESQVEQVINLESRRQSIGSSKRQK